MSMTSVGFEPAIPTIERPPQGLARPPGPEHPELVSLFIAFTSSISLLRTFFISRTFIFLLFHWD
jgi:hypothetical protein